jgi:hypothetical protein
LKKIKQKKKIEKQSEISLAKAKSLSLLFYYFISKFRSNELGFPRLVFISLIGDIQTMSQKYTKRTLKKKGARRNEFRARARLGRFLSPFSLSLSSSDAA